jgi:hypothetical protein
MLLARGFGARQGEAEAMLQRLQAMERLRCVAPTSIVSVHAGLGRPKLALKSLQRAFEALRFATRGRSICAATAAATRFAQSRAALRC